ncbi:MAG: YceI family protein [Steroidobacterales bacterium]
MSPLPRITVVGALALAACSALAAETTYTIDTNHSFPSFEIKHMGFSTFRGRFDKVSGSVTLDPAAKKGSAEVTIEVGSVSTGVEKLNEHLKTPDFFDATTYPTITFKASSFKFKGDKLVSVAGDLTMHGVTKPVTLQVDAFACKEHPFMKVPACGADAHAVIKRADWGIGSKFPGAVLGEEVTLHIQVEAQHKA